MCYWNEFTFHYGPIQIKAKLSHSVCTSSIYIPLWSYSNTLELVIAGMQNDLHSTMVLFKSHRI